MAKKQFTEVIAQMIDNDAKNGTATLGRCDHFVRGDLAKGGAHITMGIPANVYMDFVNDKYTPVLLMIDKEEYKRIENEHNT